MFNFKTSFFERTKSIHQNYDLFKQMRTALPFILTSILLVHIDSRIAIAETFSIDEPWV